MGKDFLVAVNLEGMMEDYCVHLENLICIILMFDGGRE